MFTRFMRMMKKKNNQKGFTLVELMVVVVILGILVAIAVPVYNNSQQTAERNAVKANLRIINGAISQYQANNNGSNPDMDALVGSYLQSEPKGPGEATYTIAGTPLEAQVSGNVGGSDLSSATSATLPW